jgi:hypothetical protein
MNNKTESVLMKDSLGETEKILGGKHWSEFNDFENGLAFVSFAKDNKIKKDHLQSIGDTYWGMTWDEFKDLIKERGFIEGYSYEIEYKGWSEPIQEEMCIYYHPEKGLIIWAESFNNKTTINGGTLYGEIQAYEGEENRHTIFRWLSTGGCRDAEKGIYTTSHDIREGLFSKLDTLESAGKFLNRWTDKKRFLWFVDYNEEDIEGYNYKSITKDKIRKCPKEVQDIIGIEL